MLEFMCKKHKHHFYSQGSMLSGKLEIIFCRMGSTVSNFGVWSRIDNILLEDFYGIPVPRGVFSANLSTLSAKNTFFL